MARFPKSQDRVAQLAQDLISGLRSNSEIFPAPPAPPAELEELLATCAAAREAANAAAAAAIEAHAAKAVAFRALKERMKDDLRYAEQIVKPDPDQLHLLGWSGTRPRTRLEPPGQVRLLTVLREGDTWVRLGWEAPTDGGKVAAYRIIGRNSDGPWTDIGMAVECRKQLDRQPRGVELEYQVIAVNKAGEGVPSNLVRAVL